MAFQFSVSTSIQTTTDSAAGTLGRRCSMGQFLGIVVLGASLLLVRHAAANNPLTLFSTQEDWAQWNNSSTTGVQLTAINTASLDGNITTNGLGNVASPGGSGTSGAVQATWFSGSYDFVAGPGEQGNQQFLSAIDPGAVANTSLAAYTGTITIQYTRPPAGTGNYFQLGILLNYDGNFGQFTGTETNNNDGTFTAVIPYTINAVSSLTYFQPEFIYNSNYNTNTPFTIDNMQVLVSGDPGSATWKTDGSSSWGTDANWNPAKAPNLAGATATLGGSITSNTANRIVTLDGNRTVGHIVFKNNNIIGTSNYTIAQGSSGTLNIDNSVVDLGNGNSTSPTGVPDITVMSGNHTISAPVNLAAGVTIKPAAGTSLTASGGIGGVGPLAVSDAGKFIMTAPATYTGGTNVTAGTLQIAGLTGAGNLTVGSGATLSGTGPINGSLILQSGGTIELRTLPSAIDTLSPSGGLTINDNTNLGFDIGATADSIANGGTYTFTGSGKATINLDVIAGFHNGDFNLITNASGISLSQFQLGAPIPGFTTTLQLSGNNLQVHLVATAPTTAFWRGGRVAGSPSVWTATNVGATNWDTTATSNTDSGLPSTPTDVVFAANAGTAANMANTTLGADLTINSLTIQTANPVGIGGANALTINNGLTVNSGAGTTTISSGVGIGLSQTWANNSANKMTISGIVGGSASAALNIGGTGRIRLTNSNTYAGGTTVTSGTLEIGNNNALGLDGSNVAQNGGTIEIDPGVAPVWSLTGGQGSQKIIALAGVDPTVTLQTGGANKTYGGSIQNGTGTISVVVSGVGVQIFTNANTYSGGTTINAGATLQLGDGTANSGSITGNVTSNGTLTFAGNGTTSPGSGDQSFAGNIDGGGNVTSVNVGTVTLSGNNSYTGTTTISAGTLVAGSNTALGNNANLTIGAGATLDMHGKSLTVKQLQGTSTSNSVAATITNNDPGTGTATLTVTGGSVPVSISPGGTGAVFAGAITDGPTAKTKIQVNNGAYLTLTSISPNTGGGDPGVSTFTGGVTVMPGGTLQIGNGNGGQGQGGQNAGAPSPVLGGSSGGAVNVGGAGPLATLLFQWQGGGGVGNFFLSNPINLNGNSLFEEYEGNGHYTGPMSINGTGNAMQIQFSGKDISLDGPLSGSGTVTASAIDNSNFYAGGGHLFIATQTAALGSVDNSAFTGTLAVNELSPLGTPTVNFSGIQLVIANNAGLPNATIQFTGNYNAMADIGHIGTPQNVGYQGFTGSIVFDGGVTAPAFGALASTSGGDFQLSTPFLGFDGPVTLTLGSNSAAPASFAGVISDGPVAGGTIIKIGTNVQTFAAVNTYTGPTTVQQGTLALGIANSIATTSEVILSGGKLSSGGFAQDFTTSGNPAGLKLSNSSTLDLGAAASSTTVHFADSHTGDPSTWSGTLTVTGWTYKTDHLVFGTDHNGLTNAQLGEIQFNGFHIGASISATGEVTPRIGDINQSGTVTVADVQALMTALSNISAYQQTYFSGASEPAADVSFILDVNRDGVINGKDIQAEIVLVANGGGPGGASGSGTLTAVPEPSGIVLIGLGGLIFWGRRFRKVQKRLIRIE